MCFTVPKQTYVLMTTKTWVRNHTIIVTIGLTILALTMVFAAALQQIPTQMVPEQPELLAIIPHLNAILSIGALGTITTGWWAIKQRAVGRHRILMGTSFILFGIFLILYLYRVAMLGPSPFDGSEFLRIYVYYPILVTHILLAVICVPFVIYALILGLTRDITELPQTNHKQAGRIAASLWIISFLMGLLIYALLYLL